MVLDRAAGIVTSLRVEEFAIAVAVAGPHQALILFLHIKSDISQQEVRVCVALMMDIPR
jgi:hypothetical protein